jgi:GGDEF domain-containing protein
VHGVVTVYSHRPGRFQDEDRLTLDLLAAPFGSALANACRLEATAQEAVTDALTGLGNRAQALRELDRALLRQGRRGSGHTAVIFIDLDGFKQVNDTFGHSAGDQVLVAVATKLRLTLRSTDTCARFGGDEFLVPPVTADLKPAALATDTSPCPWCCSSTTTRTTATCWGCG